MDWLILQLADSAFPTGGFAHSAGLEAAWQNGAIPDAAALQDALTDGLWQAGYGLLPLANSAFADGARLEELDELADVFLNNHVANRSSRTQGRAFLSTCARCFPLPGVSALQERVRTAKLRQHLGPLTGALGRELGLEREWMQKLCLFTALRTMVSAAVRLGIVGPFQGQQMQFCCYAIVDEILQQCADLTDADLAQSAPRLDLYQGTHDRLYSRLFSS